VLGSEENIEYKFPTSDSDTEDDMKTPQGKKLFCKANFTDGEVRRCRMLMQGIRAEDEVKKTQEERDREGNVTRAIDKRESILTQQGNIEAGKKEPTYNFVENNQKISNECATDRRLCPDNMKEIWIITHGMSSSDQVRSKYHTDTGNNIMTSRKSASPLVLFYDWGSMSQDAKMLHPDDVDQHLTKRTSYRLAKRLKTWGLSDLSILNLVGHSMGTMMINNLAIALQQKDKVSGEIARMFYLDPPSYALGGAGEYRTDDTDYGSFLTTYSDNNGYTSKGIKARIQRAFVGQDKRELENLCGNNGLAQTAKDSVSITNINAGYFSGCQVHGGVPFVFAELITKPNMKLEVSKRSNINTSAVANQNGNQIIDNFISKETTSINIIEDTNISHYKYQSHNINIINDGDRNTGSWSPADGEVLSKIRDTAITNLYK
jgi:hypothetical protein